MDSPVQIPFKSFVQLNPDDDTPLYLQIVFEFIKAIQLGLLPEGTKLPGTRILCKLLQINRNTLIKAFQDLESQGFIEISPSKGTFILARQVQGSRNKASASGFPGGKEITGFEFKRSALLENPVEASDLPFQFNDGWPDARLIHTDALARLYVSRLKRQQHKKFWAQFAQQVHLDFKKQFSNYLNLTRGLRISESKLLTTSSHEIALYLLFKVLISPGDQVVVGAPSYYSSNMTISDSGAEIISIPVDEEGIDTEHLKKICETHHIKVVYLSSVYHYPTTVLLSAKRRIEILDLASSYGFILIEDDHDFDFHFDNNPILPLATMDSKHRVIYIGSLARSLPPGFGYGFIAAPAEFIQELEKHQNILEAGIDVIKEQVLTGWIQDGDIHRLLKKNRKTYGARRDHFAALLHEKLQGKITFQIPARGLAFWVRWINAPNLIRLRKRCAERGLFLPKTILYQTRNLTATRLGFGNLDPQEMEAALDILAECVQSLEGEVHALH